jgi:hypothetical protein
MLARHVGTARACLFLVIRGSSRILELQPVVSIASMRWYVRILESCDGARALLAT